VTESTEGERASVENFINHQLLIAIEHTLGRSRDSCLLLVVVVIRVVVVVVVVRVVVVVHHFYALATSLLLATCGSVVTAFNCSTICIGHYSYYCNHTKRLAPRTRTFNRTYSSSSYRCNSSTTTTTTTTTAATTATTTTTTTTTNSSSPGIINLQRIQ
jgi:hypothetical protein